MALSIEELIRSRNNSSDYMRTVAEKSTPANDFATVNALTVAQRLIGGIRDYSTLFEYNEVEQIETLIGDMDKGVKNKPKNKMYSENGMTGILNIGMEERKEKEAQEDSILIFSHPQNKNFRIALVADGMGGHGNGDAASHLAAVLTMEWFEKLPKDFYSYDKVKRVYRNGKTVDFSFEDVIKEHLLNVNDEIIRQFGKSPGTTFSAAIIRNKQGKDVITSISIGDSKVLRISQDGKVSQLSKDDNLISEGIANGALYVDELDPNNIYTTDQRYISLDVEYRPIQDTEGIHMLNEGDSRYYNKNHFITGYLGGGQSREKLERILSGDLSEYISEWEFAAGDKIILCSDGVADNLSNEELGSIVYTLRDSEECLRNIVNAIYHIEYQKAKNTSNNMPEYLKNNRNFKDKLKGNQDNISAIVIDSESRGR